MCFCVTLLHLLPPPWGLSGGGGGGAPGGRASPSPASATPCVSQEMRAGEMSLIPRQGPPVPCGGSQALQPCWGESLGRWVWLPGLGGPDPGAGPPVPGRASWGLSSRTWVLRRLSGRRLSGRGAGGWGHISPCCGLTGQVTGRPGWSPWDRSSSVAPPADPVVLTQDFGAQHPRPGHWGLADSCCLHS